jgi:hypothetical protein
MITILRYMVMAIATLVDTLFAMDQRALERDHAKKMRLQTLPLDCAEPSEQRIRP